MPSGITSTYSQTAETDPNKLKKKLNALDKESISAQRQYGDMFSSPVTMQGAQRRAAEQQGAVGEQARRQEASAGLNQLAGAESDRKSQVSNATEAAIRGANQFNTSAAEKQRQTSVGEEFTREQSDADRMRQLTSQDFSAYSSATKRSDSITNAWVKGSLEADITSAAQKNMLKIWDVQKASSLYINNLKNIIADKSMEFEQKQKLLIEEYKRTASNAGGLISSLAGLAGAIIGSR
jgi:hypothetical protein